MARQFVVQLDNHPGELAQLSRTFAQRGVQIHHAACAGTGPLQCMFVTFTDDDAARSVLKGLGHPFIEGEPVMVEIPDEPGSLGVVSQKLADAGVHGDGRDPGRAQAGPARDGVLRGRRVQGPRGARPPRRGLRRLLVVGGRAAEQDPRVRGPP